MTRIGIVALRRRRGHAPQRRPRKEATSMRAYHDDTTRMRAGKLEHAGPRSPKERHSLYRRDGVVGIPVDDPPQVPLRPLLLHQLQIRRPWRPLRPSSPSAERRLDSDAHEQQRTLIGVRQVDRIGKGAFGQLAPIQREDDLRVGQGEQVPRAGVWQAPGQISRVTAPRK